jgi:hypothetical protein
VLSLLRPPRFILRLRYFVRRGKPPSSIAPFSCAQGRLLRIEVAWAVCCMDLPEIRSGVCSRTRLFQLNEGGRKIMKSVPSTLKGTWKITWMEMWDQEFIDLEVPGHVTFEDGGRGHFQFGCVHGFFGWSAKDDYVDSCWEGSDEMDEARGEIYAEIKHGELQGTIEFFNGDESEFRAIRKRVARKNARRAS